MTTNRTLWFVAGLVLVALLSQYAPKYAGALVILVTIVLAIRLHDKAII